MSEFSRFVLRTIAVLSSAAILPLSAAAQTAAGARSQADEPPRSLRLLISTFGGYDTDVTSAGTGATTEAAPPASHIGARAGLTYQDRTDKMSFSARGGTDSRYYNVESLSATSFSGNSVFAVDVTSRLRFDASVNGMYSPRFVFSLLPAANDIALDVAPPLDYGVSAQKMVSYAAGMNARYQVSRRSSFNVAANTGSQNLVDDNYDVKTLGYGAGYSYSFTRYASLRLGYRAQVSEYPVSPTAPRKRYTQRIIDAGVNYARPLSVSRRTTLSFGTGSGVFDNEQETYYTIIGNASLNHQIGRTWEANVVYMRGLSIVGGFTEPFFADAVNGNIRGYLSRHVMLLSSAGFSNGAVGLGSAANNYDSFQATTRLEWTVQNERVGVYANYFYQGYRFGEAPPSVTPIPGKVDRHGVSAGLAFRIPLLRERMPRVTR